jgi:membrane protease YdiL (CAAX protease family)
MNWVLKLVLAGAGVFFVNATVLSIIIASFPWAENALYGRGTWWLSLPVTLRLVYIVCIAPILEEILHRQIILNHFIKKERAVLGLFVSSTTFGLHHYVTGWGWLKVVDMFFVGLVFGWAFIRHRLAGSWLCHITNNVLAATLSLF